MSATIRVDTICVYKVNTPPVPNTNRELTHLWSSGHLWCMCAHTCTETCTHQHAHTRAHGETHTVNLVFLLSFQQNQDSTIHRHFRYLTARVTRCYQCVGQTTSFSGCSVSFMNTLLCVHLLLHSYTAIPATLIDFLMQTILQRTFFFLHCCTLMLVFL